MKLNFQERLMLLQILPVEADFLTLKITRELQSALAATETEFKDFELTQDGEKISWNKKGNEEIEIKIGDKAKELIVEQLKKIDDEKKITFNLYTLFEKFVEKSKLTKVN